jgi:8-oxo-dGTP diphosphatase
MTLFIVRHASAGDRGFGPDDRTRALDEIGRARAEQIAGQLADVPNGRLLSSPFTRCMQTLEPLARRSRRSVEPTAALAEGAPFEPVLDLLASLPDGSILCSHGDLIPDVIEAVLRRGAELVGAPSWRKGAIWQLVRDGGEIQSASIVATTATVIRN